MLTPGVTIVVSPLLSLIQDQVTALIRNPQCGIPAGYLSSQTGVTLRRAIVQELRRKRPSLKLLYVTPEKLSNSAEMMDLLEILHGNVRCMQQLTRGTLRGEPSSGLICWRVVCCRGCWRGS